VLVITTPRLNLRRFAESDAAFILALLNDPDWLRFIGDKKVRTLDDARLYLRNGPIAMYARFGLGLWSVDLKDSGMPVGMCGLIQREGVADVDIGFAFLPAFRARGYGLEAASATLAYGHEVLGLKRIVGFTSPDNASSVRLLEKLGMRLERTVTLPDSAEELLLLASGTTPAATPATTFEPAADPLARAGQPFGGSDHDPE
jgi:RimJ/RimL family protein N-acetyltransferase